MTPTPNRSGHRAARLARRDVWQLNSADWQVLLVLVAADAATGGFQYEAVEFEGRQAFCRGSTLFVRSAK